MKSPGAHGEVGGHFESNMPMQRLNMRAMIEFASSHGGAKFTFRGIEADVARIISSPKSREIAMRPSNGEEKKESAEKWHEATLFKHWKPFSTTEYHKQLQSTEDREWEPGGVGFQKGKWGAIGAWYVSMQVRNLLPYRWFVPPQPMLAHYTRDLSWVEFELWDVPWQEANAKQLKVSEDAKNFIRGLYEKSIDPKDGGWREGT